jgi:hypothetical protein
MDALNPTKNDQAIIRVVEGGRAVDVFPTYWMLDDYATWEHGAMAEWKIEKDKKVEKSCSDGPRRMSRG